MLLSSVSVTLLICGVVFLVVDVVILLIGCLWWRKKKKQRDKERRVMDQEGATYVPLIKPNPGPFTTPIKAQSDVREFEIPKLSTNVRRDRSKWYDFGADEKPVSKILDSGLDPVQYCTPQQRILKNKPKVGFEFFYDFRTTQLKVTLHALKNIQRYIDEKISVTVLMSHSTILYHSAKVNAPNPVVNEEYPFPMDSMEISSDPPITCKFNVWHIDSSSLKRPYGFVEVNIEDVLTKMTNIGSSDKRKPIWRNITLSEQLTDEGIKSELLVTLSYLSAAQRIGCTIAKAKNLILTASDKDLYAKITLLCRNEEHQSLTTNYVELSQNPDFSQEVIFSFTNVRNASIDGLAIRIDIMARQNKFLSQPRFLGRCEIGNSYSVEKSGQEHWASTLTSPKSVTKWHKLKDHI